MKKTSIAFLLSMLISAYANAEIVLNPTQHEDEANFRSDSKFLSETSSVTATINHQKIVRVALHNSYFNSIVHDGKRFMLPKLGAGQGHSGSFSIMANSCGRLEVELQEFSRVRGILDTERVIVNY
ncbi:MAG: hypothetical protein HYW49_00325 [Deltaproteobacteria bacterium]|nr:hypothetical protein [Deltaproteobacteria bacterium]